MITESSKKRLLQYLKYKRVTLRLFYKTTTIKRGFLDSNKLDSSISDTFLTMIIANYNDLNLTWLISGRGEMIIKDNTSTINKSINGNNKHIIEEDISIKKTGILKKLDPVYKLSTNHLATGKHIPLYNLEATASLVELFQKHSDITPIGKINIPNSPKCDGAVFITVNTMYPLLKSGDIVMYKQIDDFKNNIFWGEMYLMSIEVSGEEYISVKYLQKSKKGDDYIKLVSRNEHYEPKDVNIKKVRAMALIKAYIRISSMS